MRYYKLSYTCWDCKCHIVFIPIWALGCFVSTVGLDENMVFDYIHHQ